jgi:mRNA interferase YafQ
MREIRQTNIFKRDLKKLSGRSKNLVKLYEIIEKLATDKKLEARHRPHKLIGKYINKFECHIEPDWLLIYEITKDLVILYRTGSHADLF